MPDSSILVTPQASGSSSPVESLGLHTVVLGRAGAWTV